MPGAPEEARQVCSAFGDQEGRPLLEPTTTLHRCTTLPRLAGNAGERVLFRARQVRRRGRNGWNEFFCCRHDDGDEHAALLEVMQNEPTGYGGCWHIGLSAFFVWVNIYEVIVKDVAVHAGKSLSCGGPLAQKFDFSLLVVWNAALSVIVGLALGIYEGRLWQLTERNPLKMLVRYLPLACSLSFASYMQYGILLNIPVDVFKVVEQSRLPILALLSRPILGTTLSSTSWSALGAVTASIALYCAVRSNDTAAPVVFGPGHAAGGTFPSHWTLDDLVSAAQFTGYRYTTGFLMSGAYVLLMCGAGVYGEKIMKDDKHLPFYLQKVLLELPVLTFGIGRFLVRSAHDLTAGADVSSGSQASASLFSNPLCGWEGFWVLVTLAFVFMKSWLSGYVVKELSAMAKQMLSVFAVPLVYVAVLMHHCNGDEIGFCPAKVGRMSLDIVAANLAVFTAVLTYTLVRVSETSKETVHAEVEPYASPDKEWQEAVKTEEQTVSVGAGTFAFNEKLPKLSRGLMF